MKTILKFILLLAIASMTTLTSCKKSENVDYTEYEKFQNEGYTMSAKFGKLDNGVYRSKGIDYALIIVSPLYTTSGNEYSKIILSNDRYMTAPRLYKGQFAYGTEDYIAPEVAVFVGEKLVGSVD